MMFKTTGIFILCGFHNHRDASAFLVHRSSINAIHQASATTIVGPLYYKPESDDDSALQPPFQAASTAKQSGRFTNTVGPLYYKSSADVDDDDSPPPFPIDDTNTNDGASTSSSSSSSSTTSARPPRRSFLHQLDRFLTILQGTSSHLKKHTFLSGNFAPVAEEHVQVPVQVVEGRIPDGLDGAFCRNGPNPVVSQMRKRYHWVRSLMRLFRVTCIVSTPSYLLTNSYYHYNPHVPLSLSSLMVTPCYTHS